MVLLIFFGSLALAAAAVAARVVFWSSLMADFSESERDSGFVQSPVAEPETHPTWRFEVPMAGQKGTMPAHQLKG
jgi:hypothetical protein